MPRTAKVTISLPRELAEFLDECARRWTTNRSGAVQRLILRQKEEEISRLMAEGYHAMAEENQLEAQASFSAQAEVVLREH
jgi:metal-responsive CopG/Arc/MetJ family transcriptional regulator